MKAVFGALVIAAAAGSAAHAQAIDVFTLPPGGAERAYACASYLSAHSAMMRVTGASEGRTRAVLALYLVLAKEAQRLGAAGGATPEQVNARMSQWDGAVVAATMTDENARPEQFQKNALACVQMGLDQVRKDTDPENARQAI